MCTFGRNPTTHAIRSWPFIVPLLARGPIIGSALNLYLLTNIPSQIGIALIAQMTYLHGLSKLNF
jgi:hypothetical protein